MCGEDFSVKTRAVNGHIAPVAYLCAAMIGLFWLGISAVHNLSSLIMSVGFGVTFLGALLLGACAFKQWALPGKWTLGLLIVGSSGMTSFWMIPSLNPPLSYIGLLIIIIFIVGILSGLSEMLQWVLPRTWQQRLPIVGSCMMVSLFLPIASAPYILILWSFVLSSPIMAITIGLVVASLILALRRRVLALKAKSSYSTLV